MVHLSISLPVTVVALNVIASVALPIQDGELHTRTLELLESRNKHLGKALKTIENHPNTLDAATQVATTYVSSRGGNSNARRALETYDTDVLERRAGAPEPSPTNPGGSNQNLPPFLSVALFMTKKAFFGGPDVPKSVKPIIAHEKQMPEQTPKQTPKQTPDVDQEADLKDPTPSSAESPLQGSDAEDSDVKA